MNEHDLVVLRRPLPEMGLTEGDVGTIVHVHPSSAAFEVEFVSGGGETLAVLTLNAEEISPVAINEILHVRHVPG